MEITQLFETQRVCEKFKIKIHRELLHFLEQGIVGSQKNAIIVSNTASKAAYKLKYTF